MAPIDADRARAPVDVSWARGPATVKVPSHWGIGVGGVVAVSRRATVSSIHALLRTC